MFLKICSTESSSWVDVANLESANAMFKENGIEQSERVVMLNQLAIKQLKTLSEASSIKRLDLLNDDNKLK